MKGTRKIPLVVGVTGHIPLREEDRETLGAAVRQELERLRAQYPHTPIRMLCSLAAGADLLCADAAEELGIPLIAALPMAAGEYEKDFSPETLDWFRHHLSRAEEAFAVPSAERETGELPEREFRYRQAGIFVTEHCHVLLALWDGTQQGGDACGTAVTVDFAVTGDYFPERGTSVRSGDNTMVIHILAPRKGSDAAGAGTTRILGDEPACREILARTEEFNSLAEEAPPEGEGLFPPDETDPVTERMEKIYRTSDGLSVHYAGVYRRALASLAFAGTALTFTFLLYDNGEMIPMILLCGAALLYAFYRRRKAEREACHRRFIEYRALAEALRAQCCLRFAGSAVEAQRLMSWTQQRETAWILCALSAVNGTEPSRVKHGIRECWVEKQREYHRKAGKKTSRQLAENDRLLGIVMRASILLYIAVLVYEFFCGGILVPAVLKLRDPEIGRTVLKILLGTLSAGTLFLGGYYGRMSLNRVTGDHEKMEAFFGKISERIARRGQDDDVLETLAREELAENGNWISYQRDNAVEMTLN